MCVRQWRGDVGSTADVRRHQEIGIRERALGVRHPRVRQHQVGLDGMKASDLIVQCLENEQVQYVFGLPGEEILDILDSLLDSRITFVPTRHEQGAAFMADAYGRLTGRPGVCLSTLGPGATNLARGSPTRTPTA